MLNLDTFLPNRQAVELKKCVMAQNHNQGSVDKNDATSKPPFSLCNFVVLTNMFEVLS